MPCAYPESGNHVGAVPCASPEFGNNGATNVGVMPCAYPESGNHIGAVPCASPEFGNNGATIKDCPYIHQNPLRAGLVQRLEDWPFCSFLEYAGFRPGTLPNKALAVQLFDLDLSRFYKLSYELVELQYELW